MLPETCEPTCTVMTELMVPVASTTSLISPRSTLAEKCCTGAVRFKPTKANDPSRRRAAATMIHVRLFFIFTSGQYAIHTAAPRSDRAGRLFAPGSIRRIPRLPPRTAPLPPPPPPTSEWATARSDPPGRSRGHLPAPRLLPQPG